MSQMDLLYRKVFCMRVTDDDGTCENFCAFRGQTMDKLPEVDCEVETGWLERTLLSPLKQYM